MKKEENTPIKKIELIIDDPQNLNWVCTNVSRLELMGILWEGLQSLQQQVAPAILKLPATETEQ